jgi:hypothetical protein
MVSATTKLSFSVLLVVAVALRGRDPEGFDVKQSHDHGLRGIG